jgi:hypothetical protein
MIQHFLKDLSKFLLRLGGIELGENFLGQIRGGVPHGTVDVEHPSRKCSHKLAVAEV